MSRLLVCNTCKTVDKLPDYATENDPEAKHDHHLRDAIDLHFRKFGGPPERHKANLFMIADDELELIDESRLQQAVHDGRLEEFLKQEREQYKTDALGCYELHNRPTVGAGYGSGCPDYRDKSRAIGRTAGIPESEWNYLCDFCPYHSYVEHQINKIKEKKGMFK